MEIQENEHFNEHLTEILDKPPHIFLKWGIFVISLVLLLLLTSTVFIKYPTSVKAIATITSEVPPQHIMANASGRLVHIFAKENDTVIPNQALGVLENTANTTQIFSLDSTINHIDQVVLHDTLKYFPFYNYQNLGEVQEAYNTFQNSYIELIKYKELLTKNQQYNLLIEQKLINQTQVIEIKKQLKLFSKELAIFNNSYERDLILFQTGTISLEEKEKKESGLLKRKRTYESLKTKLTELNLSDNNLKQQLNSISISHLEQNSSLIRKVKEQYAVLKLALSNWKMKYLLISSIHGQVAFHKFWFANQYVKLGEEVFTIIPNTKQKLKAKLTFPIINSGEVKPGQKVLIKLAEYPSREYGMLTGQLKHVSLASKQGMFVAELDLPSTLMTNYNKEIKFKSELNGTAEIVTEDLRLIQRIFYRFRSILQ